MLPVAASSSKCPRHRWRKSSSEAHQEIACELVGARNTAIIQHEKTSLAQQLGAVEDIGLKDVEYLSEVDTNEIQDDCLVLQPRKTFRRRLTEEADER